MSPRAALEANIGRIVLQILFLHGVRHSFESLRRDLNELTDPPLAETPLETSEIVRALLTLDRKIRPMGLALNYEQDGVRLVSAEMAHNGMAEFFAVYSTKVGKITISEEDKAVLCKIAFHGPITVSEVSFFCQGDARRTMDRLEKLDFIMAGHRERDGKRAFSVTARFYQVFAVNGRKQVVEYERQYGRSDSPAPPDGRAGTVHTA